MSIGFLLIILLIIFLVGGFAPWGSYSTPRHFYGGGPYLGGGLGLVLAIVVVLLLLGRL